MRGLPRVLAIYGILFEEQVDLVIFWVVTLRNQMDSHKPGVCDTRSGVLGRGVHLTTQFWIFICLYYHDDVGHFSSIARGKAKNQKLNYDY